MVHKMNDVADWVWSGEKSISVFCCPRCFRYTFVDSDTPNYCTHCGLKFSNGGIELEFNNSD